MNISKIGEETKKHKIKETGVWVQSTDARARPHSEPGLAAGGGTYLHRSRDFRPSKPTTATTDLHTNQ